MATSAIGPGFLTQTTVFTKQLLASFGFVILVSVILDIFAQLNVWRVLAVSGKRGQDAANSAAGVLDGITMGNADTVLSAIGQADKVRWDSTATTVGGVVGLTLMAPFAIVSPAAFTAYASKATALNFVSESYSCIFTSCDWWSLVGATVGLGFGKYVPGWVGRRVQGVTATP